MIMKVKETRLPAAIIVLACLAAAIFPANSFRVKARGGSYCDGEIVVGMIPGADTKAFNERYGTAIREHIAGTDQYLLDLAPGVEVEDKLAEMEIGRASCRERGSHAEDEVWSEE